MIRHILLWIGIFALSGIGCGGAGTRNASGKDRRGVRRPIEVSGTLSVRGSAPSPIVLLEMEDGTVYAVQSSSLLRELKRLDGMRVAVKGTSQAPVEGGTAILHVQEYHLLPLESGEEPLVGVIAETDGKCLLKEPDGDVWRLTGDLASILTGFAGAKVWVIGEREVGDHPKRQIRVTGYGVLREASYSD